jgi:hypothetical protein
MKPLFVAIFEDKTVFSGGISYDKTLWKNLPLDKKIKRLFYTLPDGNHLCLENYDKYFHMCEATKDLNGNNAGKITIEYAYLFAKKDSNIMCYKINLKQRNDKNIGDIERKEYSTTDTFIQGLSKDGWR